MFGWYGEWQVGYEDHVMNQFLLRIKDGTTFWLDSEDRVYAVDFHNSNLVLQNVAPPYANGYPGTLELTRTS